MGIVMIVGSQCDGDSDDSGESVCPIIFWYRLSRVILERV